ncbi:type II CAAX endopeptidase family protein [Chamaesiphon polymorphus]|uniref:CPBP family intramembrane metalloprotease domain-containing protein n=1 Tax=Chamaesiphon polymorphus CCALA 037 TaxID=2107692 RepID=A0A2T1GK69_9CYAN|nr:type II CAAX endopeptidase family protein [Chamaesiphon polymorphus]PSB58218.1 CPBP family intramembrane metalloprotease domain-containing protein [Chamaesiphon polymorphus CCALA 037]
MSPDRQQLSSFPSLRRILLIVLAALVLIKPIFSLFDTLDRPQIQGKFELYQTNIVLVASEWKPTDDADALGALQKSIVGTDFLKSATQQYQTARKSDVQAIDKLNASLTDLATSTTDVTRKSQQLEIDLTKKTIAAAKLEIDKIDLRIGILQAARSKSAEALQTWQKVGTDSQSATSKHVAASLIEIWKQPSNIDRNTIPQLEAEINTNFDGWFRDRVLKKLYTDLGDRQKLDQLTLTAETKAKNAVINLALITIPRIFIVLGGVGLIVFFTVRFAIVLFQQRGERSATEILLEKLDTPWSAPWDWETVLQVFMVGFFFVGQFVLPTLFGALIDPATLTIRQQGLYVFTSYVLMAILALGVLYLSIKSYLPLPADWFEFNWKSNWLLWGIGGYLVATPIVVIVSLLNEKIWHGQGGSNPILQIVLQGRDSIALSLFFLTAAVAAPLFEEFLFRGFLLPSLTRYLPTWGAICLSGLLFGVAHLSLSEILPLTSLGIILGIVYVRTRNLLAPMLLHSLWNSSTLVSLYILGSGN